MKPQFRILLLLIFISQTSILSSQELPEELMIQYTGKVLDEFLKPLPFTHILIPNRDVGLISDQEGKFSIIVYPRDTIQFSSMGFKGRETIIPDTLSSRFFVQDLILLTDTFLIAEIEVYPWKDYEEFKEQFKELKLPEGDLARAQKNIAILKAQILVNQDPSIVGNFNQIMEKQYQEIRTRGQYPTYQIFNVFAWSKFIQALQNGDFKQK